MPQQLRFMLLLFLRDIRVPIRWTFGGWLKDKLKTLKLRDVEYYFNSN